MVQYLHKIDYQPFTVVGDSPPRWALIVVVRAPWSEDKHGQVKILAPELSWVSWRLSLPYFPPSSSVDRITFAAVDLSPFRATCLSFSRIVVNHGVHVRLPPEWLPRWKPPVPSTELLFPSSRQHNLPKLITTARASYKLKPQHVLLDNYASSKPTISSDRSPQLPNLGLPPNRSKNVARTPRRGQRDTG
jgi:hypothetical protein